MEHHGIPPGFEKIPPNSPFDVQFGDMYSRVRDGRMVLGFLVMEHHLNPVGALHGGALATFADWQIMPIKYQENLEAHTPTISLSIEYFSPTRLGDWLECHVKLQKRTRRMVFTHAEFYCGDEIVARANGIYSLPSQRRTDSDTSAS